MTVAIAFAAGLISFFAPCGSFLLPGFFAYSFKRRGAIIAATWWFFAGFLTLFLPIGLGLHALAVPLALHREGLSWVGGGFMIALAVLALLGKSLHVPTPSMPVARRGRGDALSVYLLGVIFGFTVAGCTAPLLGLVFTFATLSKNAVMASLTLTAYALGLMSPLLALALAADRTRIIEKFALQGRRLALTFGGRRREIPFLNVIAAAMLLSVGIVFIATQGTFGFGTLVRFPSLVTINASAANFLSRLR